VDEVSFGSGIGHYWSLLVIIGHYWSLLVIIGGPGGLLTRGKKAAGVQWMK
jgi:hypothetical protein